MFAEAQGPLTSTRWDKGMVPEADVTMIESTLSSDASELANKSYLDVRLLHCSPALSPCHVLLLPLLKTGRHIHEGSIINQSGFG